MANDCGCDGTAAGESACEKMLNDACQAYSDLLTGKRAQLVRWDNETVQFQKNSPKQLFEHIQRLHLTCPTDASRALVASGTARSLSVRFCA